MNRGFRPQVRQRSTPKVKDGKVQRKNRHLPTRSGPLIQREQPGAGFRHVVRKNDIVQFIGLLPDWDELSVGLHEIILAAGDKNTAGWHRPGVVAICAWKREVHREQTKGFLEDHASLYDRLGIPYTWIDDTECEDDGYFWVHFTDESIRAYQLLHILLHELGHHHDRMTTRPKIRASRGESFAEQYALKNEAIVLTRYCEAFGFRVSRTNT